jgi:uridine kinase
MKVPQVGYIFARGLVIKCHPEKKKHMAYLIAVGGGSGSGKTFLADSLKANLSQPTSILSYDNYYKDQSSLSLEKRAEVNYDSPDSLDCDLFMRHLDMIHDGKSIQVPQYDFATHTRKKETITFVPTPIVIVEDILVLDIPNPHQHYDFMIFVEAESDIRLARRVLRDEKERGYTSEAIVKQYLSTVRPMHLKYVEPHKKDVDFVFENSDNHGIDELQMKHLIAKLMNLR